MSAQCIRCGGEVDGTAYVDARCMNRAGAQLAEIADMVPAARDIATGQARYSGSGGGSGKPGSRLPLDLAATAKLDGVAHALTIWVDMIGAVRGVTRPWFEHRGDPVLIGAQWLTSHLEWMRHQRDADQFLTDVEACARVVRGLARGRAEQRYLGPCGAVPEDAIGVHSSDGSLAYADEPMPVNVLPLEPCEGDVYAIVHTDGTTARTGRCKTCGAEVDTAERQAWLDGEVRQRAFTAKEISDAYGINVKTIRSWHNRGQLAQHGEDREGVPMHNLGEVLDLAAADALRRHENQAKRARRAARAAESEEAA